MCRNVHPTVYYSLIIVKHLKQKHVSHKAYIFICVSLCNQTRTFVVGFALTVLAITYKLKGTFFFQQVQLMTICHCQSNVICLCSQIGTTAISWLSACHSNLTSKNHDMIQMFVRDNENKISQITNLLCNSHRSITTPKLP